MIDSRLLAARLLIVDDEQANVVLLTRMLGRAGFTHICSTTDSSQAARLYSEWEPDLILLDLRMPGLDGFGVLGQLRERVPQGDYLPILAVTGDNTPETRERVIAAGARDFLEKPFRESEILVRVENLLTTRWLHRSLQRQNELLEQKVRERTAELELALSAAEAASRAKSRFLATMSHELRTPLNAVIGFSRHLGQNKGGNLTPQDVAFLQRITENGSHLLRTISDILDLSRVESGRMPIEKSAVPLDDFIAETVANASAEVLVAGREIVVRASVPETVVPIVTDAVKLQHIVTNLLANAIKFTEAGSVVAGIHCAADGTPHRIDVVDTGVGIAPHRLDAIFDLFEQEDNRTQRRFGGSGLGLAIARTLCDVLGFRLVVVSDAGSGSAFSVLLHDDAHIPATYPELAALYLEAAI